LVLVRENMPGFLYCPCIGSSFLSIFLYGLFGSLKKEESRVKEMRVIQLSCLKVF